MKLTEKVNSIFEGKAKRVASDFESLGVDRLEYDGGSLLGYSGGAQSAEDSRRMSQRDAEEVADIMGLELE